MADTVSFGEPMVEFNSESVGGPRSGSLFSTGFGGDSSNFAVAASRLGARSSYLTKVGSDVFGALLQQMWHDEGVDASEVIVDDARPTGLYYIMRYGATSEFVYRRSGSAASTLTPDDIPEGWIEKAKVLHVTGITQAISASASDTVFAAIDRARAARVKVAYDPNIRPAIWPLHTARAVARYTISMVDVALPNLEEGRMLTGYEDPRAITEELLARRPQDGRRRRDRGDAGELRPGRVRPGAGRGPHGRRRHVRRRVRRVDGRGTGPGRGRPVRGRGGLRGGPLPRRGHADPHAAPRRRALRGARGRRGRGRLRAGRGDGRAHARRW
jgi:2-dehydro-3-deoxygluconokinase